MDIRRGHAIRVNTLLTQGVGRVLYPITKVGDAMRGILGRFRVDVTAHYDDGRVHGRSWEMSAVMALLHKPGTYSGTVESYDHSTGLVSFGPVGGVDIKSTIPGVIFWHHLPWVHLPG